MMLMQYESRPAPELITIEDELVRGLIAPQKTLSWLRYFYGNQDEDWLARRETPMWFRSEWEKYEWLFKRAIAGYEIPIYDRKFMARYEMSLEYRWTPGLADRYEQLKEIFAVELRHVFGGPERNNIQ
jgi:hypothetical protein